MVTSKIRLRKGFWSTQSKLLFLTVPTIQGKAKLRKIFQSGDPIRMPIFIMGRACLQHCQKKICVAPSVSILTSAENSFGVSEFDQQRCMVLFWVTHRGGPVPRQKDQLPGVCISYPLYITSSSRKGKKSLPLEPHIPQGGKPLNQCCPSSPLLRISASFGVVTECFVWSATAFAFQSGLAIIASEQHALPQSGHLSCWASSTQGDYSWI